MKSSKAEDRDMMSEGEDAAEEEEVKQQETEKGMSKFFPSRIVYPF